MKASLWARLGGLFRAWIVAIACMAWVGCARRAQPVLARHEFQSVQMAIPFRIVLYARDGTQATNAANAAWERINHLNKVFSDYDPDSELSRLGATSPHAQRVPVSDDMFRVLERARGVSEASEGAFDITVGPLTQLWRRCRRQRELPDVAKLQPALAATGWQAVQIHAWPRPSVRLLRPGMRLDAGGIAKGFALDEATRVLRSHGIRSSLVSGAGDIVATAPPPGQDGWRVEVAALDVPGAPPPRRVLLRHASLCTSGDVFQHVELGGVRYSHIVDPRTGLGLTDHGLVTVIGPDGMTTDALSTAISVAGVGRAVSLARRFGAEVLFLHQPADRIEWVESAGFPKGR
jgi:thiamine biosynthesis lipoprotein